ncbi:unnamed protein product, partial [Rotaria magnacalcarata]
MLLNKTIIIENGRIQKSNENYRTAYSLFDIRLVSNTNVQLYKSNIFNPNIKITKRTIHDITQLANDSNVDTEGQIIKDNGVSTTTSQTNGSTFQRRSIKIQDETGKINITIWNKKNEEIPDNVINQHIRIRNGKINVYNGSHKSTAISLIERGTREVEKYLQIKIEDSHVNGSVTTE